MDLDTEVCEPIDDEFKKKRDEPTPPEKCYGSYSVTRGYRMVIFDYYKNIFFRFLEIIVVVV